MDKVAAYKLVLSHSVLRDDESFEKISETPTREDLESARNMALGAAALHGAGLTGPGPLTMIPAGFLQRSALRKAGIDREEGGAGTFGARRPVLSGFIPFAGAVSGLRAADQIEEKLLEQ